MPHPDSPQLSSLIEIKAEAAAKAAAKAAYKAYMQSHKAAMQPAVQRELPYQHSQDDIREILANNIASIVKEAKKSYVFNKFDNGIRLQVLSHLLQGLTTLRAGDLEIPPTQKAKGTVNTWEETLGKISKDCSRPYIVSHPDHRGIYQFTDLALDEAGLQAPEVPHA
jgi:hypothetical protein